MNIIEFNNVDFSYVSEDENEKEIRIPVLKNLNFNIEKGSFTAILGHNGSGKSTIAKLTNGILVPDKGSVVVEGMSTSDEDKIFDIRAKVGMVFQNPDNQIVSSIVEEDVAFGCENLGIPPEECRKRVDDALETVGMSEFALKSPSKLSGGQKQRVAVAGIIAMKPDCIVLDEPTAMLDPSGRREVIQTIMRLNKEEGITIVLITHYMDEAVKADRVIIFDGGEIKLDGTPKQVFAESDEVKALGLDIPQSTQLVEMMKKDGFSCDDVILDAGECADYLENMLRS